jgi:hypothetical protein
MKSSELRRRAKEATDYVEMTPEEMTQFLASLRCEAEKEDSYEESDEEQDLKSALSLLETSKGLLTHAMKFLDARNLKLAADIDIQMTRTILDIGHFLSTFDVGEDHRKVIVMGPTSPPPLVRSAQCARRNHPMCTLIRCNCNCHDEELVKE